MRDPPLWRFFQQLPALSCLCEMQGIISLKAHIRFQHVFLQNNRFPNRLLNTHLQFRKCFYQIWQVRKWSLGWKWSPGIGMCTLKVWLPLKLMMKKSSVMKMLWMSFHVIFHVKSLKFHTAWSYKSMWATISSIHNMSGFKPILVVEEGNLAVFSSMHMKAKIPLYHQESVQC